MNGFRKHITATHSLLLELSEEESKLAYREGGWSKKEILGHLIDSALNNHQRFVRGALDGFYEGPFYQQEGWVAIHGYKSMTWSALVEHWRCQNELLCAVVERIPAARLDAQCRVGNDAPVTLGFLVEDYLNHLDHHARQVTNAPQN